MRKVQKTLALFLCITMALTLFPLSAFAADPRDSIKPTIQTVYPTKDYVVSDFIVTDYGAKTVEEAPNFDNRAAFQAAIDAAYNDGGGVVWIPSGHYAFRSESSQGVVLNLLQSVQLRGDWISPEDNAGIVAGTVLEVYAGRGRGLDRGNEQGTNGCFISMVQGTGVTNLSVWYPEQNIQNVTPYPWTLKQISGNSATVENVTLVNSYGGFRASPAELHFLNRDYITALSVGVEIHTCTDIGRIENVKIDPKFWAQSGLPGAPALNTVTAYTRANGRGFSMHRSDWEYLSDLYISGYKEGMWVGREPDNVNTPNAQFYRMHMDNCGTALYVDAVNGYGLLISDSIFGATGADSRAVYFSSSFNTSVQFNGVDFTGPIVSDGSGGVISFESCTFDYSGGNDITVNRGSVLLGQSEFLTANRHVYLGTNVNTFKSVNSGRNRVLDVTNNANASATVSVKNSDLYNIDPIPRNSKTDIEVQPKAAVGRVLRVDLSRAKGFNNNVPTVDVSAGLQAALNAVASDGGGIVYLPGGRYLVNAPIVVPSGVELRGTRDVQGHIQGGGSAIFTRYGIDQPNLPPLIQLEARAGLRGLHIVQLGQNTGNIGTNEDSFRKCPFMIQGKGADVYIINVTMPNADKGIDLASYKTDRHYVEYLGGSCARAGIWVGGGADGGFIRNMQGNPHYGQRFPQGRQGYPELNLGNYQREFYSALKFGDVTNQTIFNNFVFGSRNGIHFLRDEISGKNPKELTVIGHGTDGSTYGLFVEDADIDTKITMINSELVTINSTREKSYVLMGSREQPERVNPGATLTLYNTACWGGADIGAIVNGGNLRLQQINFQNYNNPGPGIQVNGGNAHVYNSFFQNSNRTQLTVGSGASGAELTNNYYNGGLRYTSALLDGVYGSDIPEISPYTIALVNGTGNRKQIKLTKMTRQTVGGTLRLTAPQVYKDLFVPIPFSSVAYGESLLLDMPSYAGGSPFEFELTLDGGDVLTYTARIDHAYASPYKGTNSLDAGDTPLLRIDTAAQVGEGSWSGPDDLSMAANAKWDDNNLYLYLVVTDDVHFNDKTLPADIWSADSIQAAINMNKGASDGGQTYTSELGFGLHNNGTTVLAQRWAAPTGLATGAFNPPASQYVITRNNALHTTTYNLTIPWSSLVSGSRPADFDRLGLSILINDSDGTGTTRLAMEFGKGVNLKNYPGVADLSLMASGQYKENLETAAWNAIDTARDSGSATDIAVAQNHIAIVPDDAIRAAMTALLFQEETTPIPSAALTVTTPVTGAVPGTEATGTGQFTVGAVSWTPEHSRFLGAVSYTATVTLTAHTGYTFTGLSSSTINGKTATIKSNSGTAVTLSYTFAATGAAIVTGIQIASQPVKLTYTHGEALNLTGLSVRLIYNDGTEETVAWANFAAKGITVNPAHGTILNRNQNGTPIAVSRDSFSADTNAITVNAAPIPSAALTVTAPVTGAVPGTVAAGTGQFTVGAVSWTPEHSRFLGAVSYTATVTLTAHTGYTFTGLSVSSINGKTATIKSNSGAAVTLSYTFAATSAAIVTGIQIASQPTKLTYTHGEALNLTGLSARLLYSDGTEETVDWEDFAARNLSTTPVHGVVLAVAQTDTPVSVFCGEYSAETNPLTVSKAAGAAVNPPTLESKTTDSITIGAVTTDNGQTVEYAISTTPAVPDADWQDSLTFTGLTASTAYYLFARTAANPSYHAGAASDALAVTTDDPIITVTDIIVSPSTVTVALGATAQLTATIIPSNATNQAITWESSHESNVSVTAKGLVKGLKAGTTATITAITADGGKTAHCIVTVPAEEVPVKSIAISASPLHMVIGKSVTLKATVSPANATDQTVTWKSKNSSIAVVDKSTGRVTAKGAGTAEITATAGGKSKTVFITVHQYVTLRIGKTIAIVNGVKTSIDDVGTKPIILSGRTMVPLRFLAEKMGGTVKYVNDSQPIVMTYGGTKVEFKLGDKRMKVITGSSSKTITLDVAAQKAKGKTYIPLRAISQALGFTVYYDDATKIIVVNNPGMNAALKKERLEEGKKVIR